MAVLERVNTALAAGNFGSVAGLLEEAELSSPSASVLDDDWPVALHMLAHVYNGDLADARLLYKRLPDSAKADPQVQAAWRLLQFAWQGSGEGVWRSLRAYPWSGPAEALAEALGERLRARQLDLVTAAYSHISPARLAALAGCSEADAAALAAARGWRPCGAEGAEGAAAAAGAGADAGAFLEVVPPPPARGEVDSLASLEQLSVYMMQLE
ncbi:hypothetical protein HYH03_010511 [Edaphochlamys debaryana]|uniref:CSN8/PSMD8/EIF3K domain-containing protein n=1 Tax=Edaphochlamys debaryana TaxID=47281 RepID=A0A836BVV4_9CHLO|nr:hypothetical protein HYH03_010511 [Edaphochlamys debaryana]|eukprot:KAG2491066.1 hypothetical protein HYH03_010511 [Edaphochlamys debaryana]